MWLVRSTVAAKSRSLGPQIPLAAMLLQTRRLVVGDTRSWVAPGQQGRRWFRTKLDPRLGTTSPVRTRLAKAAIWGAFGVAFTAAGFLAALTTAVPASFLGLGFLSDEDSLRVYSPDGEEARRLEEQIQAHPLIVELQRDAAMGESRPHMKLPAVARRHNLTAGVLQGPNRLGIPPRVFRDREGKSLVTICYIGTDLCGHPGIVHGGLLATLFDEGLAGCCFPALPHKIAVTARLEVNYRKPAPAGNFFVLRANTINVQGRKAWVEGRLETLPLDGQGPGVLIADAKALFISPKNAAVSATSAIQGFVSKGIKGRVDDEHVDDDNERQLTMAM